MFRNVNLWKTFPRAALIVPGTALCLSAIGVMHAWATPTADRSCFEAEVERSAEPVSSLANECVADAESASVVSGELEVCEPSYCGPAGDFETQCEGGEGLAMGTSVNGPHGLKCCRGPGGSCGIFLGGCPTGTTQMACPCNPEA